MDEINKKYNLSKHIKQWSRITGIERKNIIPSTRYNYISPTFLPKELKDWKIRHCDRIDCNDWMPFYSAKSGLDIMNSVKTYYVNTNPTSPSYNNTLVLCIYQNQAIINEWNGFQIVRSANAAIEKDPIEPKPSDDVLLKLSQGPLK